MQNCVLIKVLTVGEQATNCYIVWSKHSREGYVIDPGDEGDAISQVLLDEQITLQGILLTHGHFDHVLALLELQLNFPVPTYLHPADRFLLERANSTARHFVGRPVDPVPNETRPLADGQLLPMGETNLRVMHTPGHTPGSVCFALEANKSHIEIEHISISNMVILFTGDTLFSYGIEPLTHQYSNALALRQSLDSLYALRESARILPGHGEAAELADALKNRRHPSLT